MKIKLKDNPKVYKVVRTRGKIKKETVPMTEKEAKEKQELFKRIYDNYYNISIEKEIRLGEVEEVL